MNLDYKSMYDWLSNEIPDEPNIEFRFKAVKENLINGLIHNFNIQSEQYSTKKEIAWDVIEKYLTAFNIPSENIVEYIPEIHGALIDYKDLEIQKLKAQIESRTGKFCRNCNKELTKTQVELEKVKFCSEKCTADYTNNIILFWQDSNANSNDPQLFGIQQRNYWNKLVQYLTYEEKLLRIKSMTDIVAFNTDLVYAENERKRVQAQLANNNALEASRNESKERGSKLIQSAEKTRKIQDIKKSGDKVNPAVKLGAETGKCIMCGAETLKETCSEKCKIKNKIYKSWLKMYGGNEKSAMKQTEMIMKVTPSDVLLGMGSEENLEETIQ